jgi:hypothetical protein
MDRAPDKIKWKTGMGNLPVIAAFPWFYAVAHSSLTRSGPAMMTSRREETGKGSALPTGSCFSAAFTL